MILKQTKTLRDYRSCVLVCRNAELAGREEKYEKAKQITLRCENPRHDGGHVTYYYLNCKKQLLHGPHRITSSLNIVTTQYFEFGKRSDPDGSRFNFLKK